MNLVPRLIAVADGGLKYLHSLFRIAERIVLNADELADAGNLTELDRALSDLERLSPSAPRDCARRGTRVTAVVVELGKRQWARLLGGSASASALIFAILLGSGFPGRGSP
jgi:hypothetical protein